MVTIKRFQANYYLAIASMYKMHDFEMLGGHTVSFWKGQKKFYSQNKSQIAADRMARSFGDFISKGCQPAPSGFFYAGKFHSVMALLEIFKKENGYG